MKYRYLKTQIYYCPISDQIGLFELLENYWTVQLKEDQRVFWFAKNNRRGLIYIGRL